MVYAKSSSTVVNAINGSNCIHLINKHGQALSIDDSYGDNGFSIIPLMKLHSTQSYALFISSLTPANNPFPFLLPLICCVNSKDRRMLFLINLPHLPDKKAL